MTPTRRAATRLAVLLTLVLGSGAVTPSHAVTPQEAPDPVAFFQEGNRRYTAGDYAGAVEAYEAILAAGLEGADLYYNLGNAYFKAGELGRAILSWERAARLDPSDPDVRANLELARSLTADAIEPLPRFWLLEAVSWWIHVWPRGLLLGMAAAAWWLTGAGALLWIVADGARTRAWGRRLVWTAGLVSVLLGATVAARELGVGQPEEGVVLQEVVQVRSAPAEDDDLTLFEIHEGTRVRVMRRSGGWAEIALDDGKVGWVPVEAFEVI